MDAKELNEIFIGLGLMGVAAYFLWPKHVVPIDVSNPANDAQLAQLGGLSMPGLPAYLSANRPAFAIAPEPYRDSLLPGLGIGAPTTASDTNPALLEWPGQVAVGNVPGLPAPAVQAASVAGQGCCC